MAEEGRRAKRVVQSNEPKTREKTGLTKLADVIFTSDIKDVRSWIVYDQLLPWLKGTIINAISRFTLNGRNGYSGSSSTTNYNKSSTTYSYNQPKTYQTQQNRNAQTFTQPHTAFGVYDIDRLLITPQNGVGAPLVAAQVLQALDEVMSQYQQVRVMDFYDAAGATGTPECQNYGWYDIHLAHVVPTPDGNAWIDMPKPIHLK